MQFVLFQCGFKDFKFERKLDESAGEKELLGLLVSARGVLFNRVFDYAPFDLSKTRAALPKPSLSSLPSLSINKLIDSATSVVERETYSDDKKRVDSSDLLPSFYLHGAWRKFDTPKPAGKPVDNEVRLAANLNDWRIVKKQRLDVPRKEALVGLSSMFASVNNKIPDFASSDSAALQEHVDELFSAFPPRKSFGKIAKMLDAFPESRVKGELTGFAVDGDVALSALVDWFYFKMFEYCGYGPVPLTSQLNDIYPELKIPKPKGNFGGKRKKKK
ncbi:MAG: hypothetical protein V1834_01845 [Candidatus Micrarchaeota archaeon]